MRLINEDDVLAIIERVTNEAVEKNQRKYLIQPRIIAEIAGLPTVEAEPVKHGRWILSDDKNWLTCSFCGADVDVSCGAPFFYVDNEEVSHINFCPMCGARMDGGDING